jgi:hypothetical protein
VELVIGLLVDLGIGGLVGWWIGDWFIGGLVIGLLVDWWIGDWFIGGLVDWFSVGSKIMSP